MKDAWLGTFIYIFADCHAIQNMSTLRGVKTVTVAISSTDGYDASELD